MSKDLKGAMNIREKCIINIVKTESMILNQRQIPKIKVHIMKLKKDWVGLTARKD